MKIKKKKGFTLIELLIVVAIIAILAAIAIPQFSAYRIKGYNAAASTDIRNAKTAEEALFADFQSYGRTAAGAVITSPTVPTLDTYDSSGQPRSVSASLSNGCSMQAYNSAAPAAAVHPNDYLAFTKHTQGDRIFAADNNVSSIQWSDPGVGTLTTQAGTFTSTAGSDITIAGWSTL